MLAKHHSDVSLLLLQLPQCSGILPVKPVFGQLESDQPLTGDTGQYVSQTSGQADVGQSEMAQSR